VDGLERSRRVDVVRVGAELETRALDWLRQHDEREFSFVDATSFMLMDERRLRSALAFDGEFSAAGFAELRAP
jgi:predicted nucleic acid-binding protein